MEYLPLIARIFFWVCSVAIFINFLYSFTPNYEKQREIRRKLGKETGINIKDVLYWTAYIFSMYFL